MTNLRRELKDLVSQHGITIVLRELTLIVDEERRRTYEESEYLDILVEDLKGARKTYELRYE